MMKSRIICILLLLVGVSGIYAQSLTVTGKGGGQRRLGSDWRKCDRERKTKHGYHYRYQW